MKIIEIALGMKRSVRLKQYVIITPEVWLKAELAPEEDPDQALDELRSDMIYTLDQLEESEAKKLGFVWDPETGVYHEEITR